MKLVAYRAEHFEVDLRCGEIIAGAEKVTVEPQVYHLLVHLMANNDRIVSIDELLEVVWNGRIVSEATVLSRISAVRTAIRDNGRDQHFIRTFRKRGFRYVGSIEQITGDHIASPAAPLIEDQSVWSAGKPDTSAELHDNLSIAVFPFEPNANENDQHFLAAGIATDIATELSRSGSILVIAPAATGGLRDGLANSSYLAEQLGAKYFLKGYLALIGQRVRLNVQLHDALNMRLVWAERFQGKLHDIFDFMNQIVTDVMQRLSTDLPQIERRRALRMPEAQLRAYGHVLRGDYHHSKMTKAGNLRAIASYRKAIDLDDLYAPAFAGLAWAQNHHGNQGWSPHRTACISQAFKNAQRAIELEGRLAKAYSVMGDIQLWQRDHEGSVNSGKQAILCDPSHADSRMVYSYCLAMSEQSKEALKQSRFALRCNPVKANRIYFSALGHACYLNGNLDDARQAAEAGIKLDARHRGLRLLHAAILVRLGDLETARSDTSIALALDPNLCATRLADLWPYRSRNRIKEFGDLLQRCGLPK